jgi:transposase
MEDPMRVRQRYTEEFRRDAVALVRSTDRSFSELASDWGVSSWTLRQWYEGVEVPKKSRRQRKADAQPGDESKEQKPARSMS